MVRRRRSRKTLRQGAKSTRHKRTKKPEMGATEAADKLRGLQILSLRTFMQTLRRNWHRFFTFWVIVCVALALGYYARETRKATTVMSLNYENGSKGRNPNGTRFNVSDLRAQEVMESAIDAAGLTGQIAPETLTECISITPTVQRSTGGDSYYISTSYQVTIDLPEEYRQLISPEDMLGLVCREFRTRFYSSHVVTARALPTKLEDIATMEYSEFADYLRLIASQADDYLEMRLNSAGSFVAGDGSTFQSLRQSLTNFMDYDMTIYDALIWERGIARDQAQEISLLSARNHTLQLQYTQYSLQSAMYRQIVDEYDNSMTASVLIPTYDSNREYYMARTKTGVDTLSRAAYDHLALAAGFQDEISINEDRIDKLGQPVALTWYTRADRRAQALSDRLSGLLLQIRTLDDEYISSRTRNAVTFKQNTRTIAGTLHLKDLLPFSLLACVLLYCFYVRQDKRRLKKRIERFDADSQAAGEG